MTLEDGKHDFTVSKHINGRDWVVNPELGGLPSRRGDREENSYSTKKTALNKAKGRAQEYADRLDTTMVVASYTASGKKTVHEVSPSY